MTYGRPALQVQVVVRYQPKYVEPRRQLQGVLGVGAGDPEIPDQRFVVAAPLFVRDQVRGRCRDPLVRTVDRGQGAGGIQIQPLFPLSHERGQEPSPEPVNETFHGLVGSVPRPGHAHRGPVLRHPPICVDGIPEDPPGVLPVAFRQPHRRQRAVAHENPGPDAVRKPAVGSGNLPSAEDELTGISRTTGIHHPSEHLRKVLRDPAHVPPAGHEDVPQLLVDPFAGLVEIRIFDVHPGTGENPLVV